jgi:hypothetical protein
MKDLENIPCTPDLRLASLDISNMYTKFPMNELLDIIENACKNSLEPLMRQETLCFTRLIVTQNYFGFEDKTYLQKNGLAVGAPTSSALSEIYLQFIYLTSSTDLELLQVCRQHTYNIRREPYQHRRSPEILQQDYNCLALHHGMGRRPKNKLPRPHNNQDRDWTFL